MDHQISSREDILFNWQYKINETSALGLTMSILHATMVTAYIMLTHGPMAHSFKWTIVVNHILAIKTLE